MSWPARSATTIALRRDRIDAMRSRLVDRLMLAMTAVIFVAALVLLYHEFEDVALGDVIAHFTALPKGQLLAAAGVTAASYMLLTGYDFLALRYVRRRLCVRDVLLASFIAFAFSNSVGLQVLSGGSMRYRIYSSFGLGAVEIGEIVGFCTAAYALGVITLGGLLALFNSAEIASLLHLPQTGIAAGGVVLLGCSAAFLAASLWGKSIALGPYRLRAPSFIIAIATVVLASLDAALAGTVVYVLLPVDLSIGYLSFLSIYLVAATASVLSLVPGGLGVFESVFTLMTAPQSKAAALGVFLVYRLVYFIIPLVIAIGCFLQHELAPRRVQQKPGPSE
jgi:uncharacterized membrane protein YbhN (UPF0104 family)